MRPFPRSTVEFADLVDQTISEVWDSALCAEDATGDEMSNLHRDGVGAG